jgi:starch synthase (maltosyl-transferring)
MPPKKASPKRSLKPAPGMLSGGVALGRHILIENVQPSVDGGLFPVRIAAGRACTVQATALRDGHDPIRVELLWRSEAQKAWQAVSMHCINPGLDLWQAEFTPPKTGLHYYSVEAWSDAYLGWSKDFRKRVEAGVAELEGPLQEGVQLIAPVAAAAEGADKTALDAALAVLMRPAEPRDLLAAAEGAVEAMGRLQARVDAVRLDPPRALEAAGALAAKGAWYEFFVRSQGPLDRSRSGTFKDAEGRLDDIAAMGFDVIYLAPIHPIGKAHRKGPNNSLTAGPGDPGSPWAIGSEAGGHTAIEPALGTLEDFDRFVAAAAARGLAVALDFAIQCSPDHPWVKLHPDWFYHRPDGSIKYAENPPKKYQDVYVVNFDTADRENLWDALESVLRFWIARGVRIFRVDNPHTKPLEFWRWALARLKQDFPDLVFLAEAFTRPAMMRALGKVGFNQSYTYFTWRNSKAELTEYLNELCHSEMRHYYMPNFFANTPDILPTFLQKGGAPGFRLRLVLAATLSPVYGIYSGYELCEDAALPGREEYLDSEKYELRPRDWNAPGNIKGLISRLNQLRRSQPALGRLDNLHFTHTDNEQLIAYLKAGVDGGESLLVVVNLDRFQAQQGWVQVPLEAFGLPEQGSYRVEDLLDGSVYQWEGRGNFVKLDPALSAAHVFRVQRA